MLTFLSNACGEEDPFKIKHTYWVKFRFMWNRKKKTLQMYEIEFMI